MRIQSQVYHAQQRSPIHRAASASLVPPPNPETLVLAPSFDLDERLKTTQARAASIAGRLGDHVAGQLMLKLPLQAQAAETGQFFADYGVRPDHELRMPPEMQQRFGGQLLVVELPPEMSVAQALAVMEGDERILRAEANLIVESYTEDDEETPPPGEEEPPPEPPDDLHPDQWNLRNEGQTEGTAGVDISADEAWDIQTGRGDGPIIAVIDSGVDYLHPEMAPNMWVNPNEIPGDGVDNDNNGFIDDIHGANFVPPRNGEPLDDSGHGTHVASVIGAKGHNGQGMTGINWDARIMSLKFLESSGRGTIADAISAIGYAEANGARVVVNGWGSTIQNQSLFEAIEASSAMHICAAGNDGYDNDLAPIHPASFGLENIISVAATDHNDEFTATTNLGSDGVDLAAPGRKVYSLSDDGEFKLLGGTATSAAHVAGVAGLILSEYPEIDNHTLRTRLLSGVDPLPERADRVSTGGRLNAAKALEPDDIAPAEPGTLWVAQTRVDGVDLTWEATGDDGVDGLLHHYELRYSDQEIVDSNPKSGQVTFENAAPLKTGKPKPSGEGESYSLNVGPSGKQRKLYFALRAVDNVGNKSKIATAAAELPAVQVSYEDRLDGESTDWVPEGEWARVPQAGRGSVFTDSPGSDYANNRNDSVTSPTISLKGWKNSKLYFDTRHTIEVKHDACYVEVYGYRWWGGTKWRKVARIDGYSDWKTESINLRKYDGQDIKVRFRLETDDDRTGYGLEFDNVVVTGDKRQ